MKKITWILIVVVLTTICFSSYARRKKIKKGSDRIPRDELKLDPKIFAKLDTFEAVTLEEADKTFNRGDFVGALAAYKSFTFEFTKSKALSYALYRMGRCLHLVDKRNAAIKAYQNVVDYFPDDVKFASAAMYMQGMCHMQNGDNDKCVAVWAKMVQDRDYINQPNSGTALEFLAKEMDKRKKYKEAVKYRWRTAVNFRQKNPTAANAAGHGVVRYYVEKRNLDKLKEFCIEGNGTGFTNIAYGGRVREMPGDPTKPESNSYFWGEILNVANQSQFGKNVKEREQNRKELVKYWVDKVGTKFKDNEDFQIALCNYQLVYEENGRKKWIERLDALFNSRPISLERVKKYIGVYGKEPKIRKAFFDKHARPIVASFKTFEEKLDFANYLGDGRRKMYEEQRAILLSISTKGLNDKQICKLGRSLYGKVDEEHFLRVMNKVKDKALAAYTRFKVYWDNRKYDKCLPEIEILNKYPQYSQKVAWERAECLYYLRQYAEAIKAYRTANRQPDSTWRVIDCQVAMQKYPDAIKSAEGLQMVGGGTAARACLKIADIYKISGNKGKEIEQLRLVLRRYPKSRESSSAHQRLEGYGVKLYGGVSTADE